MHIPEPVLIGKGAQYKVYDTHHGRVHKVPLTIQETRQLITSWYAPDTPPPEELNIDYQELAQKGLRVVQRLLGLRPELSVWFGNPHFAADGSYTQDKVEVLGNVIARQSQQRNQQLVDDLAVFVLSHWRRGISETNFNILVNYGLNKDNQLVLIDFGEMTDSKKVIQARVAGKRWLKAWSFKKMPPDLQTYYSLVMQKYLTKEALDQLWAQSC